MDLFIQLFKRKGVQRLLVFAVLGVFLYLMRGLLNLLLLTFILTYLMYSMQSFIIIRLKKILHIKQKIMVAILYIALAFAVVFGLYKVVPQAVNESTAVINHVVEYYQRPHVNPFEKYLFDSIKGIDVSGYTDQGVSFIYNFIKSVGNWGYNILIAFVLSLFFLLEKNRIMHFTSKFKTSKISGVYLEIAYFGRKFVKSFGKVLEAQVLIAFINSILSVIALAIMGFHNPFALGIMIFLLSLIPVAGTIISLFPLSFIAFNEGGIMKVVSVLLMIVILHVLESYILNPKLMSAKTELPVFYTFVILIVSEHFLGTWGLIIGIPIFMFLMDVLEIDKKEGKVQDIP